MAEKETKEERARARKIKKKVEKAEAKIPTKGEINKARKAELVDMCKSLGLNSEGKVEELRQRLMEKVEAEESKPKEGIEEEVEIVEEEGYIPKLKPKLSKSMLQQLILRKQIQKRRPIFLRQEGFRYKRLGEKWRKPRGTHSKMRRHFGYRPNVPSIGFGSPRAVAGLHPSGFQEVLVHNVNDLERIDPKIQAARIGSTVGSRKRMEIQEKAKKRGIRILNWKELYES